MMPSFHPDEALLLDYAAGSADEPVALLLATHLALCPDCRAEVERLEALGGGLLDELEPVAIGERCLDELLARLQDPAAEAPAAPCAQGAAAGPLLPRPLRDYLGDGLDRLPWRTWRGVAQAAILEECPGYRTAMFRLRAGATVPRHSHEGTELTLVLDGGFTDRGAHYIPGDFVSADASVDHGPVADPDGDCLCLVTSDAPLRLTGPLGRLLNRFVRL